MRGHDASVSVAASSSRRPPLDVAAAAADPRPADDQDAADDDDNEDTVQLIAADAGDWLLACRTGERPLLVLPLDDTTPTGSSTAAAAAALRSGQRSLTGGDVIRVTGSPCLQTQRQI